MNTAKTARSAVLMTVLLPAVLISGWAQSRASWPGGSDFTVQVMAAPGTGGASLNSRMDLGPVSRGRADGNRRSHSAATHYTITRRLQLRVTAGNAAQGRVLVQAFMVRDCYPCRVKLDGTELSASPTVVLAGVELNKLSDHRLEIEIPVSMSPGAIDAEIGWQVDKQ